MKAKIPLCWALRTSPGSTKRGKDGENRKQVSKGKREGVREKNIKQVQWPHEHCFKMYFIFFQEIPFTRTEQCRGRELDRPLHNKSIASRASVVRHFQIGRVGLSKRECEVPIHAFNLS